MHVLQDTAESLQSLLLYNISKPTFDEQFFLFSSFFIFHLHHRIYSFLTIQ